MEITDYDGNKAKSETYESYLDQSKGGHSSFVEIQSKRTSKVASNREKGNQDSKSFEKDNLIIFEKASKKSKEANVTKRTVSKDSEEDHDSYNKVLDTKVFVKKNNNISQNAEKASQ